MYSSISLYFVADPEHNSHELKSKVTSDVTQKLTFKEEDTSIISLFYKWTSVFRI